MDTLRDNYAYQCNVDDVAQTTTDGVIQDGLTTLRAHFIDKNQAISASAIQS